MYKKRQNVTAQRQSDERELANETMEMEGANSLNQLIVEVFAH